LTRRYTHTVEWLNRPNATRAKKMVRMRADGWTYAAIGKKYKVSRQRAHQIVKEGAHAVRKVQAVRGESSPCVEVLHITL
jgi:hypothetical protein